MKSTMEHNIAEMGCFDRNSGGKQMVIGNYSDTLMHSSLFENKEFKTCRKTVMSLRLKECQRHSVHNNYAE